MFSELGIEPSAFAVAQHYGSIIDGLLIDKIDDFMVERINSLGVRTYVTDIVMHDRMDRGRLGTEVVEFIQSWEMLN
jgi:hypothetical protein